MPNPFTPARATLDELQRFKDELQNPLSPNQFENWQERFLEAFPRHDLRDEVVELRRRARLYRPTPEEYLIQQAEAAFDRQADQDNAEESPSRRYERPPSAQFLALREKPAEAQSPLVRT
jgi:hypothetical protein